MIISNHLSVVYDFYFFLKGGAHLKSEIENLLLASTSLETTYMREAQNLLRFNPILYLKLLHKLLLYNILELKQVTLPNGLHLMSNNDFETCYSTPSKLIKSALHIAEQLFKHPTYQSQCGNLCPHHPPPHNLKNKYIINNHKIAPKKNEVPIHVLIPPQP